MLPLNIGLPKTPHGLPIDRCHKPCPSVIPNTDQPKLQPRPLSPDPVLPQCWPSQDTASWCLSWGEAKADSPDGRHHQSQLRWVCHPMVLPFGLFQKLLGVSGL